MSIVLKAFATLRQIIVYATQDGFHLTVEVFTTHRSVQSQLQTENVPGIWHMPNYSLISWVPKTEKNKKIL